MVDTEAVASEHGDTADWVRTGEFSDEFARSMTGERDVARAREMLEERRKRLLALLERGNGSIGRP